MASRVQTSQSVAVSQRAHKRDGAIPNDLGYVGQTLVVKCTARFASDEVPFQAWTVVCVVFREQGATRRTEKRYGLCVLCFLLFETRVFWLEQESEVRLPAAPAIALTGPPLRIGERFFLIRRRVAGSVRVLCR